MKVEYMEPFVEAARSVLEQVAGGAVEPGMLSLLGTTFPTASTNIAARIDGSLKGDVVYSMSSETAQKLVTSVMGAETRGFGRTAGFGLNQLGAMLAEQTDRVLSEQGIDCEISSPIVFQGMNVEFAVPEPALSVPIDTEAGELKVSVAVRRW
ncbi:MAG: hypothetical protein ABFD46_10690 [Armatimonadota bacterium]